ncbi:diguanylate cyclase [Sediminispirochaeta bajacaliforniensis]|uniref:diguanylate cyclase n=1 Tax=Sediminispirochaeta bajacaliforniensis TaxID=148 RepID=UPI00037CC0E8|nr:diguanylate cyclase [Sediminispirochaeta bajacaliforniensis]
MDEFSAQLKEKLAALADEYIRMLPERFREIKDALMMAERDGSAGSLPTLRLLVHKLAGSGATFGFKELSRNGKALENRLEQLIESGEPPEPEDYSRLREAITALEGLCEEGEPEELEELEAPDFSELQQSPDSKSDGGGSLSEKKIIHLVDRTGVIASNVVEQLGYYGYEVEEIDDLSIVRRKLESGGRRLLIVNTEHLLHDKELSAGLSAVKRHYRNKLGIIFVSEHEDFMTRLQAVRAGGDAFFLLPLDIGRLVDKIDGLVSRVEAAPYHILIVDDDPEQVAYYAFLLQQAGMVTSVASDPMKVLSILIESKPELILMDMYMPGCSGIELTALLRQHEAFVGVPIVFLSFESNKEKQMEAICRGGDDFLTKPINPDYLVQVVSTRAERNRNIRYFMERDSLTGLLNHTNLKEHLSRELLRASRSETFLAFAMIDADHFKRVNDTYGHLTGDRVLKNLARLLLDRLRRTDIIGRYGGEEFGIILLNTDVTAAERIMNEIRENFSRVIQQSESEQFFVTFSCGIAGFPECADASTLSLAADKALYSAKENGRNRVVVYHHQEIKG